MPDTYISPGSASPMGIVSESQQLDEALAQYQGALLKGKCPAALVTIVMKNLNAALEASAGESWRTDKDRFQEAMLSAKLPAVSGGTGGGLEGPFDAAENAAMAVFETRAKAVGAVTLRMDSEEMYERLVERGRILKRNQEPTGRG